MGGLKDFLGYLEDRHTVVHGVEQRLCALQEKYETFYAEVGKVRESELQQLTEHVLRDRSALPRWFDQAIDETEVEVAGEYDRQIEKLGAERDEILVEAELRRRGSVNSEHLVRERNLELDDEEERLKARNAELLAGIERHNARISELARGFGFFANFFKMRGLAAEKRRLDSEHADIAARIDSLRAQWVEAEGCHANREHGLRRKWLELSDRAAGASARLEALTGARQQVIVRSTLERVLSSRVTSPREPAEGDPPCRRCATPNPPGNHFCHICAARLSSDRPDLEGSLAEIAELNHHFERFSEGMRACQEVIGLVRGIKTGIEAFTASVEDVQESERKYPLPKLEIEVPPASVDFGQSFERLAATVGTDLSLHPKVFAERVQGFVDEVFTEAAIKAYFETMGEELSIQAGRQWE